MKRFLRLLGMAILLSAASGTAPVYPPVTQGVPLLFPRDYGAHPDFRTEWWYITGWLHTADGRELGFQVTFFRTRPAADQRNPSAFAPTQILFAHAALSDPAIGQLLHDQRAARAGFGLAEAATSDTDLVLEKWRLTRNLSGVFKTQVVANEFALDLSLAPSQPVLLQGVGGYSRKSALTDAASYYYSLPHLVVGGSVVEGSATIPVTGQAWLDREWSSKLLDADAVGWDWLGLNLDDGGALAAFQIRDAAGNALWAGGSLRNANGDFHALGPDDVSFAAVRRWHSDRTGADYPVERVVTVTIAGQMRRWRVAPLFDDQELDSRPAGPIYWEGAVRADGGRGYLELTGYLDPLKM